MLELPHAVVGSVIAAKVGNPALALPLAVASHFALDLVPHWNPHLNTELSLHGKLTNKTIFFICLDITAAALATGFLAYTFLPDTNTFLFVMLGGLMGILPDLVEAPYFFFGVRSPIIQKLLNFQKSIQNDTHPALGLFVQVLLLTAAFWWMFG